MKQISLINLIHLYMLKFKANTMKRLIILLTISLMTASLAFSQSSTANTAPHNPNAPEITFEKVVHDYGTIYRGADGKSEFRFTNTGKEPLILSRPRSNCGCTVPTWPRQPILPGKSGVITVVYDTKRFGAINKAVTIFSNAKNNTVVLRIKGNVKQKTN